uniref:Uncharacterized protein n=1 Tax=Acrobeloides nanus TaxID=290746 RepID=A0A914EKC8_9BILA
MLPPKNGCKCCPYGYHIDLDFVKFAENVTTGNEQAKKWTLPKKSRRKLPPAPLSENGYGFHSRDTSYDESHRMVASPMDSIFSKSVEDLVSDFEELCTLERPAPVIKNRSDSSVSRVINQVNGNGYHSDYGTYHSKKSSMEHTPRSATLRPAYKSTNEELRQIFSERSILPPLFPKSITSAPSSPTPKTYYTALAQTMSQIKKKPPPPPPKPTNRPDIQAGPVSELFFHLNGHSTDAKPPAPLPTRRYTDVGRPRVLSPEPEAAPPAAVRSSNLQSRVFYSPNSGPSGNVPYRGRMGVVGSSGGLDMDSFASVRRKKSEELFGNYPKNWEYTYFNGNGVNTAKWKFDGYTSDAPLSAPYSRSFDYGNDSIDSAQTRSTTINVNEYVSQSRDNGFAKNSAEKIATAAAVDEKPITKHCECQTIPQTSDSKSVFTEIADFVKPLKSTRSQTLTTECISIGVDTADLIRPLDLSVEFQYCIGHEPELHPDDLPHYDDSKGNDLKTYADASTSTPQVPLTKETGTDAITIFTSEQINKIDQETHTESLPSTSTLVQTEAEITKNHQDSETQTNNDWLDVEVKAKIKADKEKRKSVDAITETEEEEAGEFIMITCAKCDRTSISNASEHYEKILEKDDEYTQCPLQTEEILHDVLPFEPIPEDEGLEADTTGSGSDEHASDEQAISPPLREHLHEHEHEPDRRSLELDRRSLESDRRSLESDRRSLELDRRSIDPDTVSIETDVQTVIFVEDPSNSSLTQRQLDPSRAEAIRKLLTEPQRQNFSRDKSEYRSYRDKSNKVADDLEYIADRHTNENDSAQPSNPSGSPKKALKEMVVLKKNIPVVSSSNFPDPIPAKIPRPKVSRYNPNTPMEHAETPDEEEEAADRLTPLRSELRSLSAWGSRHYGRSSGSNHYRNNASSSNQNDEDPSSTDSSDSEGTYDMNERDDFSGEFELSIPLKEALDTLNTHLNNTGTVSEPAADWAFKYVQHEWLKVSTKRNANAVVVERFIDILESYSLKLMDTVVNLTDQNGNTALHYAVSHENYDVVSVLLDSKVCKVDETNTAGYSPVMLAALCVIKDETEATIIQRLFEMGNVNAKAVHHGQTALMLAVSHGRMETTQLLLDCGADVNAQDCDGSTALMCAAEHGQKELIKMLLKRPNIDASLTDC